ncbi:hypothetical protein COCNU_02G015590 [Cocos nucifera]|uniref:Uncharacterized protein n=1 Tax=Cocos nucifera TaxID=13894 RepID=A0A8K0I097_COCNU|nr:hypothetical protein COCNU_02G015590 [Cocos nucifera]
MDPRIARMLQVFSVQRKQARALSTHSSIPAKNAIRVSNVVLPTVPPPVPASMGNENLLSTSELVDSGAKAMVEILALMIEVMVASGGPTTEVATRLASSVPPKRVATGDHLVEEASIEDLSTGVTKVAEIANPPKLARMIEAVGLLGQMAFASSLPSIKTQIAGMNLSLPKVLGQKIHQKRKAEPTGNISAHVRVELLPALPTSKSEEPKPLFIDNFEIIWVQHDLGSPVAEESQKSSIEYLFSKVILSLPAPDVSDLFLEEESIEAARTFRTALAGSKLEATTLEDYELASKAFFDFLYPANVMKLLIEPHKIKRQKALDYFIQVAKEASMRANVAERRVEDAEIMLKKSTKENSRLLGIKEALTVKVEELKAQSTKAEAFKVEAKIVLKMAKEKIIKLKSELKVRVEAAASKAVESFRASAEFKHEKIEFAIDTYDEEKCFIQSAVTTCYLELNLNFLDEVPVSPIANVIEAPIGSKNIF